MNSLQTNKSKEKSQDREMDGLDSKCLERQALRDPSQGRNDDQRSGKCNCNERPKIQNSQDTFMGKPT